MKLTIIILVLSYIYAGVAAPVSTIQPDFDQKNPQAKGIILSFYQRPDVTQKELIVNYLKKEGLVKRAEIKRFKTLVFDWSKWRTVAEARKVCEGLPGIPHLEYCEPDYLNDKGVYNHRATAMEEIANAKQGVINAERQIEITKERFIEFEQRVSKIQKQMAEDKQLAVEKKRVRIAKFAIKGAKRELEKSLANNSDKIKRARQRVRRLEKLIAGRKKRVENRKKWFQDMVAYVEDNNSKVLEFRKRQYESAKNWLENRKKYLAKIESRYSRYLNSDSTQSNPSPDDVGLPDTVFNPDTPEQSGNLKSCNTVSSNFGLLEGQLSDYWAQRMVGTDLLKEALQEVSPIEKHLVEVFDIPPSHSVKVRNLISDEGAHSVLPEIGDKIGTTNTSTSSRALLAADRLLNKVDKVCTASLNNPDQGSPQQGGGGFSQQGSSDRRQTVNNRDSSSTNQEQEIVSVGEGESQTEYIMLHGWSYNRNYDVANVIMSFAGQIEYIDNPHVAGLKAAGESYSPTIHAIPNTEANRAKLEQFIQRRGTTVYKRDLQVIWKTATDWNTAWKAATEGRTPSSHYDLEATYEVDRSKTRQLYRRGYQYIFRPPVLDMSGATSISTDKFNWIPSIVLLNKDNVRKLKIWGTRQVGNGSLTINGVSVSLTLVSGTISDVAGSSKRHGRWEVDLTEDQYNTIYNGGVSTNSN